MNDTSCSVLAADIISVIVGFLKFNDAIHLCMANRSFYSFYRLVVAKYSFVSVNIAKISELNVAPFLNAMNMYINSIRRVKEPVFQRTCLAGGFNNLKYLHFGSSFNQPISHLPVTVESIVFDPKSRFNHRLSNLNCNLRHITFGKHFDQHIGNLPDTVTTIRFADSSRFNRTIRAVPKSLSEIHFGMYFNKNIDHLKYVKKITFTQRSNFNQDLCIGVDFAVEYIVLGMYYNCEINIADSSIRILRFHKLARYNRDLYVPDTLEYLFIGKYFNHPLNLPPNTVLEFYKKKHFKQSITRYGA